MKYDNRDLHVRNILTSITYKSNFCPPKIHQNFTDTSGHVAVGLELLNASTLVNLVEN